MVRLATAIQLASLAGAVSRLAFSIRETAQMLGVCEKSVRRLIDRGLLKTSRALRHHRVTKQEIERFLKDTM